MAISAQHTAFTYPDYISAMPADDLIKLAVKKQEMYDEGVQKVQQNLDAYSQVRASLEKDSDKQYFDNMMNDLVKTVNQSAGLDFSNKANVQAVLNIGKPLENDVNLVNAVESSNTYRQRMAEYKALDPKFRSPSNDDLFFSDIKAWKENPNVGAKLEYQSYIPYQEGVVSKYGDAIKTLKPNIETQITMSPDGRFITTSKISTVDAQRVRDYYLSNLNPAEKQQLEIDARYQLKNLGADQVHQSYIQSISDNVDANNYKISSLTSKLEEGRKKLNPADPRLAQIENELQEAKILSGVLTKKLSTPLSQTDSGELINYLIESQINDAANSYAYQQVEQDFKDNPYTLTAYKSELDYQNAIKLEKYKNDLEGGYLPGQAEADKSFMKETESVASGAGQYGPNLRTKLVSGLGDNPEAMAQVDNAIAAISTVNGKNLNMEETLKRIALLKTSNPQDVEKLKALFPTDQTYNNFVNTVDQITEGMYDIKDYKGRTVSIKDLNARDANMAAGYTFIPKESTAKSDFYLVTAEKPGAAYAPVSFDDIKNMLGANLSKILDIRQDKPETNNG